MIRRVFKRSSLVKDFNTFLLMIMCDSTISPIFGMWDMALEYIDKSSCDAQTISAFRDNETVHFLTKRATVSAASSPLRRRLQNLVRLSDLESVSSLPITRRNDSKIHGKAMEQKNRQTRAMLHKSYVNEPESALGECEGLNSSLFQVKFRLELKVAPEGHADESDLGRVFKFQVLRGRR